MKRVQKYGAWNDKSRREETGTVCEFDILVSHKIYVVGINDKYMRVEKGWKLELKLPEGEDCTVGSRLTVHGNQVCQSCTDKLWKEYKSVYELRADLLSIYPFNAWSKQTT